jgi:iron(III) transport system ATP-binding protein
MLQVKDLCKHYSTKEGKVGAVRNVTFDVKEGEFFTLLGPSGCGKTTTLRCIAGLEVPEQGEILINGVPQFSKHDGLVVPPNKRDISMVFQSYAIWPHMSVYDNVVFPLEMKRMPKRKIRAKVMEVLQLVELEGLEKRPAPSLSGGQQQRF